MGLFGSLLKTAIDVATLPIDVAKDVVTFGGTFTDKEEPYTVRKSKEILKDGEEVLDDIFD